MGGTTLAPSGDYLEDKVIIRKNFYLQKQWLWWHLVCCPAPLLWGRLSHFSWDFCWVRSQEISYILHLPTTDLTYFRLILSPWTPTLGFVTMESHFVFASFRPLPSAFLCWCLDLKSPNLWFDQSLHFHPLLLYWPEAPHLSRCSPLPLCQCLGQPIPGQSLIQGEQKFDMILLLLCLIPMVGGSFGNHTEVFLRVDKLEEQFILYSNIYFYL